MMRGLDNRKMKRMMQQMGIKTEEIKATEVVIKTDEGELVFSHPQVTRTDISGQKTFQIIGTFTTRKSPSASPEDVALIVAQTGADEAHARQALEESGGDIAAAILKLNPT